MSYSKGRAPPFVLLSKYTSLYGSGVPLATCLNGWMLCDLAYIVAYMAGSKRGIVSILQASVLAGGSRMAL